LKPKDGLPYYQLGCLRAAAGNYEEALKLLIQAGENDMNLAKNLVREAMVSIFHLVGVGSPLANQYRSKLSSLLY
jgi:thioredoxin-like negative regulator of GroEL